MKSGCVKSVNTTFHTPKLYFYKLENPQIFDLGKAMDECHGALGYGNVSFAQEKFLSKNCAQVFAHPPAPFPEAGKGEIGEIGRRMEAVQIS
jgi:hypothetical protein